MSRWDCRASVPKKAHSVDEAALQRESWGSGLTKAAGTVQLRHLIKTHF